MRPWRSSRARRRALRVPKRGLVDGRPRTSATAAARNPCAVVGVAPPAAVVATSRPAALRLPGRRSDADLANSARAPGCPMGNMRRRSTPAAPKSARGWDCCCCAPSSADRLGHAAPWQRGPSSPPIGEVREHAAAGSCAGRCRSGLNRRFTRSIACARFHRVPSAEDGDERGFESAVVAAFSSVRMSASVERALPDAAAGLDPPLALGTRSSAARASVTGGSRLPQAERYDCGRVHHVPALA